MIEFSPAKLATLDSERFRRYQENLDFYNGHQWKQADLEQWRATDSRGRERTLVLNYTKTALDKITAYLLQGLNFPCYSFDHDEALAPKIRRAESLLAEVADQNNLEQLDWETEIDTAILGDGCYKVIWDTSARRIKVVAPDVRGIYAWWLGDDLSAVWRVASKYSLTKDEASILYSRDFTKNKIQVVEVWTDKTFDLYLDNQKLESKPNPYGFIPFVIFPNSREPKQFWGTSDIPPLVEAQRELNRSISQLSRVLEVSGNPITVLENVEAQKEIKVLPGAVWHLPEDARAYLLDLLKGGGVRLHIDYGNLIYRAFHDLSEMPRAAYGGVEKELSGAALTIELQSLIQKVQRKRCIRAPAYHRRTEMILSLAQRFLKEDFTGVSHKVVWGPILPADVIRKAQSEQLLVNVGVHSRRTAMDEMGVKDPEAEFDKWLQERKTIREQNIELPSPSTRGGSISRVLESAMVDNTGLESLEEM